MGPILTHIAQVHTLLDKLAIEKHIPTIIATITKVYACMHMAMKLIAEHISPLDDNNFPMIKVVVLHMVARAEGISIQKMQEIAANTAAIGSMAVQMAGSAAGAPA